MLSTAAVAERLDVGEETVRRWCRTGQMQAVRLPAGAYRVEVAQLERWVAEHRTGEQPAVASLEP